MKRKTSISACVILALALFLPAAAAAKKAPATKRKGSPAVSETKQQIARPGGHAKFFVKAGYAVGLTGSSKVQSWSVPYYSEDLKYRLASEMGKSSNIDLGFGYYLTKSMGIGLGAVILANDLDAGLTADVPHPYVFNSPRNAAGAYASTLKATAIYLNFIYRIDVKKFAVDIFAGPAFFNSSTDLLNTVTIQDTFPNETVTMSLTTENVKKSGFGFNVGAGFNYFFARSLGFFVQARYLSGNAAFLSSSGTVPEIQLTVGGLNIGAGLMLRF